MVDFAFSVPTEGSQEARDALAGPNDNIEEFAKQTEGSPAAQVALKGRASLKDMVQRGSKDWQDTIR